MLFSDSFISSSIKTINWQGTVMIMAGEMMLVADNDYGQRVMIAVMG